MVNKDGQIYSTEDGALAVSILPPKKILADAYQRFESEKLLPILFNEGVPDIYWFVEYFSNPNAITFACWYRSLDQDVPTRLAGIGLVDVPKSMGAGYLKAEISVGFFREFQRRKYTMTLSKLMIEWTFDNSKIELLCGTTPEGNPVMRRFLKALGFDHTFIDCFTTWEGKFCGAWISWLSRAKWGRLQNPDF